MATARQPDWSAEHEKNEVPESARGIGANALILVLTDDGSSIWSRRTRHAAVELARAIHGRLLFYDRSAESRLTDGYASGPWTADSSWSHGERMLEPEELHILGRSYLANAIAEAASAGVPAWGWLPKGVGRRPIADAVHRFGVDFVVVPSELRSAMRETPRRFWERPIPSLAVPLLVAGPDGSLLDWQFATELSAVGFVARQFGIVVVRGSFSEFEVRLDFDEANPEATRVEARIAAASLSTGLGVRDRDLRGPDFFDVDRHPYLTFRSTSVERGDGGTDYWISGDLEIKGIRREIRLRGSFEGVAIGNGYRRATLSASANLNRCDWNLTGGPMIRDEVRLSIRAVAVRPAAD